MPTQQLILSPAGDFNAAAVTWGLQRSGHNPTWARSASIADDVIGPVSLQSDGNAPWEAGSGLGAARFSSVWYRWPRPRDAFPNVASSDLPFVRQEWRQFQENFCYLTDELSAAFWVNRPVAALRAENKVVQLQEAARCSLRFPPTLISNDPEKIREFVRSNSKTIYKPFRGHGWKDAASGKMYEIPAVLIDEPEVLRDDVLALCPGIYQRYVEKTCDLRVTVIGDRVFPVRIRTRSHAAFVDWRPADEAEIAAEICELPATTQARIKTLMGRLGIVYGAVDLAVDANGEIYFLEVNQVGQFLFIERWVQSLPLLQAMCAMLAEGRPDYSLSTCSGVSFRDWLASDHCEQWQNEPATKATLQAPPSRLSIEGLENAVAA